MKTQWTQGPWAIEPVTHMIEKRRKEGKPTSYTANIIPTPDAAFRGYVCHMQDAEHINGIAGPECEANARLIAAAPEMAELLAELTLDLTVPIMARGKCALLLAKIKGGSNA